MPVQISLHPEAEKAFNARARALISQFEKTATPGQQLSALVGSAAHVPIAAHIGSADFIGPVVKVGTNPDTGEITEITIAQEGPLYRLARDAAASLASIARGMAARPELRDICDAAFVQDSLLDWLSTTVSSGTANQEWVASFIAQVGRAAQETSFRVPIDGIAIEREFPLGTTMVRYFSKADVDALLASRPPEQQRAVRQLYERDYQGKVCVDGRSTAVPSRARSLAIEAAENVVFALRFVHPASFDIRKRCRIDLYDRAREARVHTVLVRSGTPSAKAALDQTRRAEDAYFAASDMPALTQLGLGAVASYLTARKHSELQDAAWAALQIFVHGVGSHLIRERLIGALVAAESLLLISSTEPIQKSLGQRMARLVGSSFEERKQLLADLRLAYERRSAFVHHGHDVDEADVAALNRALFACREVVHFCLKPGNFQTRDELVAHLDDLLMS
jgi:hypothetical protein